MNRYFSHLASAATFINSFVKAEPLSQQLKKKFAASKKYGSKDRKSIASLCYNYYRLGAALPQLSTEEKIKAAVFLCDENAAEFLQHTAPLLFEKLSLTVAEKLAFLNLDPLTIFPFADVLGEAINPLDYTYSLLVQPKFFVRIRPGKEDVVKKILQQNIVVFEELSANCICLPQHFKTAEILSINKDVVVQDYNSQQVFKYLQKSNLLPNKKYSVWDCCAASGGKSILMYDILKGNMELQVSDVRPTILNNLKTRFEEAGIKNYRSFIADISIGKGLEAVLPSDIIICDVPCSGSGTWARTPEQISFFNGAQIEKYSLLQKSIAAKALLFLKKDGIFFYITCSAFKKENEEVVDYLVKKFSLQLLSMEYLKGYNMQADTMFVAVLCTA